MTSLLQPIQLGDVPLANRIIVAPPAGGMQCSTDAGRLPCERMRSWYAQRAAAGLIVTQATAVSPFGVGCHDAPGIWNSSQIQAWQAITDAVHAAGGRIFLRLWHAGRVSDPEYLSGAMPVAPSAVACNNDGKQTPAADVPAGAGNDGAQVPDAEGGFVVPRCLQVDEIRSIVGDFELAAQHAHQAGFDGVEIQAGDGYLIDQFLHDGSNRRTDGYGGPVQNRSRFLFEVVDACVGVWGPGRVGVHLSPRDDRNDMRDSDPLALYTHVARELGRRGLAFICVREKLGGGAMAPAMRKVFDGVLVLNGGYDADTAHYALAAGLGDAVAFGRAFVSNPDLVQRLADGEPLLLSEQGSGVPA